MLICLYWGIQLYVFSFFLSTMPLTRRAAKNHRVINTTSTERATEVQIEPPTPPNIVRGRRARGAVEEVPVVMATTTPISQTAVQTPSVSAIAAELFQLMKAEGMVMREPQPVYHSLGQTGQSTTISAPMQQLGPSTSGTATSAALGAPGQQLIPPVRTTTHDNVLTENSLPLSDIVFGPVADSLTGPGFSSARSTHGQLSHASTSDVVTNLTQEVRCLLDNALTESSKQLYRRAFHLLFTFLHNTMHVRCHLPISIDHLALFIAHLVQSGFATSTIYSYVSAIGYAHKLLNHTDPTQIFVIRKMLTGLQKKGKAPDTRLPITQSILQKLVSSLSAIDLTPYEILAFKSMYLLAFHAFLRIGEIAAGQSKHNLLQLSNIQFFKVGSVAFPTRLEIKFESYKGHYHTDPMTLSLQGHSDKSFCPVYNLYCFLQTRGSKPGPLYIFQSGKPVSYAYFTRIMKRVLLASGYSTDSYKSHSFRIGAASLAATMGVPEGDIQAMGRWHSRAFKKYIRIPTFSAI
ncbi:uncharacterized protein LOC117316621 [Pecten maximus]|uniref:uncharacterized protein LOC117316621 n=1 Tax=Pecten maximus TaxID=6579 RepID=UPI001458F544|nr:uncharacterized protein LOC117316621 [Pecten maximus]